MIAVNGLEKKIPEGIELLGEDDLYNVPIQLIGLAESIENDEIEQDGYTWSIPRHFGHEGNGFDQLSMEELSETLQADGILFPFICRWVIDENGALGVQIIDGERRYLAIKDLIKKNLPCYNRKTKTMEEAAYVHTKLPCRILSGNDKEALKIAFMVSDRAVNWGESAVAKLIKKLRDAKCSDKEILEITKKGPAWLREQDRLCALDELTFSYLANSKINRAFALKLTNIEDLTVRHQKLLAAYEDAVIVHDKTIKHMDDSIEKAESKVELVEAVLAESILADDAVAAAKAQKDLEKAQKAVERRQKKKDAIQPPIAKTVNLKHTQNDEDVEDADDGDDVGDALPPEIDLPLSLGKIKKQSEQLQELLDAGGKDSDGKNLMQPKILQVIKSYIDKCIVGGEEDIVKFLKRQRAIIMLQNKRQLITAGPIGDEEMEDEDDD